ncbi:MAG: MFS transporter [Chloroflexi bacterium]|nr:MFS transporter [Chloroflexota bacterium]
MPRLFYGWYIAIAGSANNFLVLGFVMIGASIFIEPIRDELGWSVTAIAFGFSLRSFEQGLLAPLTGMVIDVVGARRMAFAGAVFISAGLLIFAQSQEIWHYYLASFVMSFGLSIGSGAAFPAAIMKWFEAKRGRATGVMNAGNAAAWFAAPVLALLVESIGWRSTVTVGAVAIFIAGMISAYVVRDRPEDLGMTVDGAAERRSQSSLAISEGGLSANEALRTPALYLLAVASALGVAVLIIWTIFLVPHLQSTGFSLREAAIITGLYGACQLVLRVSAGWVGDRFGRRRVFTLSFAAMAIGFLAFTNVSPDRLWLLPIYYLCFGFGHAAWLVLQMAVIADYFGTRRFATVRGLVSMLQMPMNVAAPLIAGWSFDVTGSYHTVFTIFAFGTLAGMVAVMAIRRPAWSDLPAARAPRGSPPGDAQSRDGESSNS